MSEQQHPSSSSLSAMQAFALRIEVQTPHLKVLQVYGFPRPFIEVKDTLHGIIVGFSSEADYIAYCQVVNCRKGA